MARFRPAAPDSPSRRPTLAPLKRRAHLKRRLPLVLTLLLTGALQLVGALPAQAQPSPSGGLNRLPQPRTGAVHKVGRPYKAAQGL